MTARTLVVIGAGPKAMAIAAKNAVLADLGFPIPEIHIVEKQAVGANWTGDFGFTNGRLALGTSPEKDVGFPYASDCWGGEIDALVNARMRAFSWQSYLVDIGEFSDWVDRGRPAPEHRRWASYLRWVYERVGDRLCCHRGEVTSLRLAGPRWEVGFRRADGSQHFLPADGVVMTGPGRTRGAEILPNDDRVLTVESFWPRYRRIRRHAGARVAIVGAGENAASIAMSLLHDGGERLQVDILCPKGMAYSRGESFQENRVYSRAENAEWTSLSPDDRRQFIQRTDRGVFSLHAQRALDQASGLRIRPGRLAGVERQEGMLRVHREYAGRSESDGYDYVVAATGSDPLGQLDEWLSPESKARVLGEARLQSLDSAEVESSIGTALELSGLRPPLHLPMLSGLAQGPGFANLSCLGRLSDRILKPYVE